MTDFEQMYEKNFPVVYKYVFSLCSTLYRIQAAGVSEPEQFYQSSPEGTSIWCFTMDREENIYTLSWVHSGNDRIWSLRKYDGDMNELQSMELTNLGFPAGTFNYVNEIYVDSNGNIVMQVLSDSGVYLFDSDFNFLGKDSIKIWTQEERFIDAGEAGCFFWDYDFYTEEMIFRKTAGIMMIFWHWRINIRKADH